MVSAAAEKNHREDQQGGGAGRRCALKGRGRLKLATDNQG